MAKSLKDKLTSKEQECSRLESRIKADQERVRQLKGEIDSLRGEVVMQQVKASNLSLEQVINLLTANAQPDSTIMSESLSEALLEIETPELAESKASISANPKHSAYNDFEGSPSWPRGEIG